MKKGYFFTLDAVAAIVIIAIGIMILLAYNNYVPQKSNTEELTNNVVGLFSNVQVKDLCNDFSSCSCSYGNLSKLCHNDVVTDPDMTLMDVFGLLYFRNREDEIGKLVNETLIHSNIFPNTHGLKIELRDHSNGDVEQLYPLVN